SLWAIRCSGLYPANSPSKGIVTPPSRLLLHREALDLSGDNIRVRESLDAEEAAVLGAEDAALEVREVVELAELLGLVRVVQVADEPVSRVAEDVPLDRADLLRRVDQPDVVLGALLRGAHPDVGQVQFARRREDVVRLLDVDEDVRRLLRP